MSRLHLFVYWAFFWYRLSRVELVYECDVRAEITSSAVSLAHARRFRLDYRRGITRLLVVAWNTSCMFFPYLIALKCRWDEMPSCEEFVALRKYQNTAVSIKISKCAQLTYEIVEKLVWKCGLGIARLESDHWLIISPFNGKIETWQIMLERHHQAMVSNSERPLSRRPLKLPYWPSSQLPRDWKYYGPFCA